MTRFFHRKLGTAIFGASLALNVVLAAWIVTHPKDRGPPSISKLQARMIAEMPAADRPAFQAALEAEQPRFLPAFREMQLARARVDSAIAAQPFSPDALREALRSMNRQWTAASDLFGEAMIQGLSKVSPEGRRAFAQRLPKESD
ncbi:periplasmic heavy metal sensor [Acetobacteraceae bacterium H6797]|nr:periplasmic heavy metal sensor [Acetobacteraceae bacterium H6797]